MKLSKIFIIAVLSGGIAFTSCRNERGLDDEVEIIESESTDAELRTTMDPDDDLTTRISENRNITTFRENMERNQMDQNWDQNDRGTTTTAGTVAGQDLNATNQDQASMDQEQEMEVASVSYTIFAPSNEAYENLSETQRNEMMDEQNRDRNIASINYLMVEDELTEEDLRNLIRTNGTHTITTMQGETITAVLDGDEILLSDATGNEARIIETDTGASGGVVHVIDRVLMPMDPDKNAAANNNNSR